MQNTNNERLVGRAAAASAGTATVYEVITNRPFIAHGYSWMYESTEANADNTLDFVIDYTTDGSAFTTIKSNGNANGLLNTSAPLVVNDRRADAASGGGAALATDTAFVPVRVPANAVVRFTIVTAGTGTIPAIQLCLNGSYA